MQPVGVFLISAFFIFTALVCISGGLMMLLLEEQIKPLILEEFRKVAEIYNISEEILNEIYFTVSFCVILIGLVYLLDGVGLFMLKNWARYLAILLSLFQMLYSTLLIYSDPFAIIYTGISVFVIWYLLRKDISELFGGKKPSIEERILGQR
ncbi:MAG: hypothetical protein NOM71_00080 [Archaeoglobi archaeon]|jgi:hypothetical protein|nr:hypothetical protein [Archaeoglobi archaeon]